VVREYQGSNGPTTYNASSAGGVCGYVPVAKKNWPDQNGQSTGISVMNTSTDSADVWVTYYDANGNNTYTEFIDDLPGRAVAVLYNPSSLPDTFLGSAVVEGTRPVVLLVNESGSGRYKASNGFLEGGTTVYIPEVYSNDEGRYAGMGVQNVLQWQPAIGAEVIA